jgi:chromosome segregation ATPase
MAAMDYDGEITELKRRMDEMEREVDGEKMLSRHIYQKVQANERLLLEVRNTLVAQGTEITGLRTEMTSLRTEINSLRSDVNTIRADLNKVKTDVALIRAELPGLVADAVIQAIRALPR